ncbi:hypothetical protein IWW39_003393 [Coemansia spiralis]|uniref:Uncharacterized protein n=1 Tax=Coemansia spiralis TaxID=417178 RepID=A0A9W8GIP2_9FUNG|nr:hypothetical protein IWW39_003393 [Coemansia spiralis]
MDNFAYTLDDSQCSVPSATRRSYRRGPDTRMATTATAAHATATIAANSARALPAARAKRTRKKCVNPLTDSLGLSVEPNCSVCNCLMGSWDLYFDHIMFDRVHNENVALSTAANTNSRTKPTAPTASSPSSSSSSIHFMKGVLGSSVEDQTSSPLM